MRVLFVTYPAKAHAYPQVPLAWALRAAGHEVCVISQPDVVDDITGSGLTAVPIGEMLNLEERIQEEERAKERDRESGAGFALEPGEEPDPELLMRLDELQPEKITLDYMQGMFTVMASLAFDSVTEEHALDELVAFMRGWGPDLVIWDPLVFAGGVAAQACGAAHARMLYGLDLVGWMRGQYLAAVADRPALLRDDPMAEWLDGVAGRYGGEFSEDLVMGQWTIDPMPGSLRLPVNHHYVPVRYVPYNGPAAMPEWLREPPKRPRVCLTLGLSFREVMGGDKVSIGELLGAAADLDVEVVATLDAEQLATAGRVPDNVRAVDFVPLNELLPTCSAIVHQGGFGSTLTALAHGVPQVIIPADLWDTEARAQLMHRSGAALHLPRTAEISAAGLRDLLVRVLEERSFQESAARLRTEALGTLGPADLVPVLERLTAISR
ncbi:glycosyl transferase family 28 [Actinomadura craniellae]|uniref:Glycosyl transferase family 28 n=1 Tax=Actinomadura craniellae TaxID=2231787 RepID=A0A365H0U9_9ACTN|nr:activator-dependent family glycosyltransferase [Actinomadura craniellae]RAY12710.1 glycosyl transferase family 28 [Actinomadura craniellae]